MLFRSQRFTRETGTPNPFGWVPLVAGAPIQYGAQIGSVSVAEARSLATGKPLDQQTRYMIARTAPFQNFWGFSVMNYATKKAFGTPVGQYTGDMFGPFFSGSSWVQRPQKLQKAFK